MHLKAQSVIRLRRHLHEGRSGDPNG
jgi:hypothetical protein